MFNFINAVKGALIGVALIVPGLSGSILAIILGVYEQGLYAVANFRKSPKKHALFLFPIALGCAIGILASAGAVVEVTARFPAPSFLFFSGLVIGSAPLILRKVQKQPFKPLYLIGTFIALGGMISLASEGTAGTDYHIGMLALGGVMDFFTIFFAGLFSVAMLAIPGVSGSIVIIILGHYGTIYNAISETVSFMLHFVSGNWEYAMNSFATVFILVPFALGTFIGFITIAKIITWCLQKAEVFVYYCVIGALLGSIYLLLNMGVFHHLPTESGQVIPFILIGIVSVATGIMCTVFLDKPDTTQ